MNKLAGLCITSILGCNLAFANVPVEKSINNFFTQSSQTQVQKEQIYKDFTGRDYAADVNTASVNSDQYEKCMQVAGNLYQKNIVPMAHLVSENEENLTALYGEEKFTHLFHTIGGFLLIYNTGMIDVACENAPVNAIASLSKNQSQLFKYWEPTNGISGIK